MSEFKNFLKKDFVVIIAGLAALVSCAFVPVTNYTQYIDTDVLGTLFSLMLIISGLESNHALECVTEFIVEKAHITGTRRAAIALSVMTFFVSMLVTNDAALIALVPITVLLFSEYHSQMVYVIVVQTVAANLGSMITPFGNPQNLLIFSSYDISAAEFFGATLPVGAAGLAAVILLCAFMKNRPIEAGTAGTGITNKRYIIFYAILFLLVLLSVFKVIDILVAFASVCAVVIILEPNRFFNIDYGLLLTFVFFFIFVGNIQNIRSVCEFAESLIAEREFLSSLLISQVISNVPAAVMITGFTNNWKEVMLGTDIGGLGTPIASLASLISLRIYSSAENSDTIKFIAVFSAVNFSLLAVLGAYAYFILL